MIRLQKALADAGMASRRAAERLILEGKVTVNGRVVRELGTKVEPNKDQIAVDGEVARPKRHVYLAINKPRGFLCTRKDPEERATVGELLPAEMQSLHTVGRLDRDSEGLLFLTNDGQFSLRLTHPRYGISKIYIANVVGRIDSRQLATFTQGVLHDGEMLKADRVRLLSANNSHSVVELELSQGRNREVRRLFETLGREVADLRRVQIGPIRLAELQPGRWRFLTETEVKSLLRPARSGREISSSSTPDRKP
jgi:23S rRNA pseudouridine2605 synthase